MPEPLLSEPIRKPVLHRAISLRGPHFYAEPKTGETLFVIHLDGSTQIGPRLATADDIAQHADAYEAFLKDEAAQEAAALARVTFTTPPDAEIPPPLSGEGAVAKARGRKDED